MVRRDSSAIRNGLALAFIAVLAGAGPIVQALTESAPGLSWVATFSPTLGSSTTLDRDKCGSPLRPVFNLDVDWSTSDPIIGYTEVDGNIVDTAVGDFTVDQAITARLSRSTGGTIWEKVESSEHTAVGEVPVGQLDSVTDVVHCALALDQRGRVYTFLATVAGSNHWVHSPVYRRDNGATLQDLNNTILFPSGNSNPVGVFADLLSDPTDEHPRVIFTSLVGASVVEPSSPTNHAQVCDYNVESVLWGAWELDSTQALWVQAGGSSADAETSRFSHASCVVQADQQGGQASGTHFNTALHWNPINGTIDAFGKEDADSYLITRFDAADTSDPLGSVSTVSVPEADAGWTTIQSDVWGFEYATDGNPLVCGRVDDGGVITDFFGRIDIDAAAFEWVIEFATTDRSIHGCKLGTEGSVYIIGHESTFGGNVYVRRYCCINANAQSDNVANLLLNETLTDDEDEEAADIAEGFSTFFRGIGCRSAGGLYFCGLILVLIGSVATGSAFVSLTKSKLVGLLGAALAGFALMVFLAFAGIWDPIAVVILIILCSAVVTFFLRRQFSGA